MKKIFIYTGAIAVLALGACKKETQPEVEQPVSATQITLPNGATLPNVVNAGDTLRLTSCNTYILNGKCYIDSLATIIIGRGVTIKGVRKTSAADASALVVCRGGRILADGTATQPITFTSNETTPQVGDWGGVVILGRAPVNKVNPIIEGIDQPTLPAGIDVRYGGSASADNSGRFQYVKILYAGAAIAANNELNGLTLGGVGTGTGIHHIFVGYGQDDAIEVFGGTVNLKHIIAHSPNDDCFDFDFGYRGYVQFALALVRSTNNVFNGDANGIESDNDGTGSAATPRTRPVISNMTIIGGECSPVTGTLHGNRWRRNSDLIVRNSIIMGYNTAAVFEGGAASTNFTNNIIHAFTSASNVSLPATNTVFIGGCSNDEVLLNNPFGTWCSSFDARPAAGSPAVSGSNFSGLPTTFFTSVAYRGAFAPVAGSPSDWNWAAFACDNTPCN